jgi:putative ABC transport system substrate-binding protein
MRELGYVEGRTVVYETRGADGKPERLAALGGELVRLRVNVIVAPSTPGVLAARQAGATMPIVMTGGNPLDTGLVASLARPGGNVTGVTTQSVELSAKRLELARELVPGASHVAILGTGSAVGDLYIRETQKAAQALGVRPSLVSAPGAAELDGAFSTIVRERPAVLLVTPGPVFFGERRHLADLALQHRLPAVYASREFVEAGGLIGYGVSLRESFRRASLYVDKILRGAKPADLPIEQPTKFELVVNLKTATALGLTIRPSILARADEIIR